MRIDISATDKAAIEDSQSLVERLAGPYEVYGGVDTRATVKALGALLDKLWRAEHK